jgi:hypothetical protein
MGLAEVVVCCENMIEKFDMVIEYKKNIDWHDFAPYSSNSVRHNVGPVILAAVLRGRIVVDNFTG